MSEAYSPKTKSIPLLLASDPAFPSALQAVTGPRVSGLYYRGTLPAADLPLVAIVGTRKASRLGLDTARVLARELAASGVGIVSGLALGIDGAAHAGALEGGGKTYAVLARGLDKVYPASHAHLARQIVETGGGLISEYPPGTESLPSHFLARNRIISGLALATIVIEAPMRSGALSTARFARSQKRLVLVTPGAINHPNYQGSHALLKHGAQLVTSAADVLQMLGLSKPRGRSKKKLVDVSSLAQNQQIILTVLMSAPSPLHSDALCDATGLDVSTLSQELTSLLLGDYIREDGGRYSLR